MNPSSPVSLPATEPLRATLLRTVPIAIVIGTGITLATVGMPSTPMSWRAWLGRVVAVLWFSFGGHWIEVAFLRFVLPDLITRRMSAAASLAARVAVWMIGGAILGVGALLSFRAITGLGTSDPLSWPAASALLVSAGWGAVGFALVECVVHTVLTAIGRPSAWRSRNGRFG